jgi:hypothetical protein
MLYLYVFLYDILYCENCEISNKFLKFVLVERLDTFEHGLG